MASGSIVTKFGSVVGTGIKFAIEYYGIDNVMYGSDYPCWEPKEALRLIEEINLSEADKQKLFVDNVRRIFGLPHMHGKEHMRALAAGSAAAE
jgi:predicted TIM-barrel fold metal-dependent hydrolase